MRIVCVTHGGPGVGYGHLSRTTALAEGFAAQGCQVVFRLPDAWGEERIRGRWQLETVGEASWHRPEGEAPDLYVIDHYKVSEGYFNRFERKAPVMYIDDLCQEALPVSIIHNGHFYGPDLPYEERSPRAEKLLGPAYFLLGAEFSKARRRSPEWPVRDLMVTTGGTDPYGVMPKLLSELAAMPEAADLRIHVIVGAGFDHPETLLELGKDRPSLCFHQGLESLAGVMATCQLAVAPTGTTFYELAALGVPAVVWEMVDNQRRVYQGIMDRQAAFPFDPQRAGSLSATVRSLLGDRERLLTVRERVQGLVDGQGVRRTVDHVINYLKGVERR